jgi:hypothetical protein
MAAAREAFRHRRHHEDCAKWARPKGKGKQEEAKVVGPRIRIDGTRQRARMVIWVNGERTTIQEGAFVPLLRVIAVHLRSPGMYSPKEYLRISPTNNATSRIREPFRGVVPADFEVLERAGGGYRLNPAIVVEHVGWKVLAEDPNPQIKKLAKEQCDRLAIAT